MNKKSLFRPSCTNTISIKLPLAALTIAGSALMAPAMAAPAYMSSMNSMNSMGSPASASSATVMMQIDPATSHVNVDDGTTVNFGVGNNAFAWHFDVPSNVFIIDLNRIAPPNVLDHQVRVYVAPSMLSIF